MDRISGFKKLLMMVGMAVLSTGCGQSSIDPRDVAALKGTQNISSAEEGSAAWVMTSSMFISTSLPAVLMNSSQTQVPGWGATVTPCSSPGSITTTYNPTGPVWCAENSSAYPSLCAGGYTPQFGIISVCTSCPSGQWASVQIAVNLKYFGASYSTIQCVQ